MSDRIYSNLQAFRFEYSFFVQQVQTRLTSMTAIIAKEYEHLLSSPQTPESREDADLLMRLNANLKLLTNSMDAQMQELAKINSLRHVERYFNMENGELVEVSKEEWKGLPDDDEEDTVINPDDEGIE